MEGTNKLLLSSYSLEEIAAAINNMLQAQQPQSTPQPAEIITREELCKRLAVSEPTVRLYEKRGKIPFFKLGGSVRYNWPRIVEALESNNKKTR
ncbi:DNA binding domain-containing protein, excisionase family [Cnuella takakiae]|uniref:DNA binding domain-containing protein, excisionase family n=1 Tax=Cnuella takakiae TaxID=1302690 RepID=A0A1M5CEU1_9BACT|nr:helix-turn-helix domain-containing protein [Cnuella takakiae]OLY91792.1 hypothetical protein BUE76_07685 [Cnuella takakiae]SHF53219.1 DNA binding domain-containing protein, excisionase family [Cnuella takakiae]